MQIKNRIAAFQEEMTSWRHHFHENPELAYKEINTSKKVVELLKSFGINNIEEGFGKTGVVATLENGTGKSIGLRADMDALPIFEEFVKILHPGVKLEVVGIDDFTGFRVFHGIKVNLKVVVEHFSKSLQNPTFYIFVVLFIKNLNKVTYPHGQPDLFFGVFGEVVYHFVVFFKI